MDRDAVKQNQAPATTTGLPKTERDFRRLAADASTHGDGFALECAATEIGRLRGKIKSAASLLDIGCIDAALKELRDG